MWVFTSKPGVSVKYSWCIIDLKFINLKTYNCILFLKGLRAEMLTYHERRKKGRWKRNENGAKWHIIHSLHRLFNKGKQTQFSTPKSHHYRKTFSPKNKCQHEQGLNCRKTSICTDGLCYTQSLITRFDLPDCLIPSRSHSSIVFNQ